MNSALAAGSHDPLQDDKTPANIATALHLCQAIRVTTYSAPGLSTLCPYALPLRLLPSCYIAEYSKLVPEPPLQHDTLFQLVMNRHSLKDRGRIKRVAPLRHSHSSCATNHRRGSRRSPPEPGSVRIAGRLAPRRNAGRDRLWPTERACGTVTV